MGLFDDLLGDHSSLDPFSSDFDPLLQIGATLDPAVLIGAGLSGDLGESGSFIADPLDLFGEQAEANQEALNELLQYSAQQGIAQQEMMDDEARAAFKPYYDQGVAAAGKLSALYTGEGDSGYTPSALYEYQKEKGLEGITAQQSKMGLRESSATAEREAGLVGGLAAEDVERYAGGLLSQVQMGSGSAQAMSQAGQVASGNIGALYSALGSGLNATSQAYGQARQASFQTAGNTVSNLGGFMG